jgi:hypothetical protein
MPSGGRTHRSADATGWDDVSDGRSPLIETGVGQFAHESDTATAIDKIDSPPSHQSTQVRAASG